MKVIYLLISIIFTFSCAYGEYEYDDASIPKRGGVSDALERDYKNQRIPNALRIVRNKRLLQERLKSQSIKQYYPPGKYYINGIPQTIVQPHVGVLQPVPLPVPIATNPLVLRPYPNNFGGYLPTQLLPYQPPQIYPTYLNYRIPSSYIKPQLKMRDKHTLTPYVPPSESRKPEAVPQAIPKTFYPLPKLDSDHVDNIPVLRGIESEVALDKNPTTENPVVNSITTQNNDYLSTENSKAQTVVTENTINEQYNMKSEKVLINEKIKGIKDCPCLQKLFNITEMDNGEVKHSFDCKLIQRILNSTFNSPSSQKISKIPSSEMTRLKQKFISKPIVQGKIVLEKSPLATDLYPVIAPSISAVIAPHAIPEFKVFVLPPAVETYSHGISPAALNAFQKAVQQYALENQQPGYPLKYPDMKDFVREQIIAYDQERKQELLDKIKRSPTFQQPAQTNKAADRQKALLSPTIAPLEFLRDMSVDVQDASVFAQKYPQMKNLIQEQLTAYDRKRKQELLDKIKRSPIFQPPAQANNDYANVADRQKRLLSPTIAPLEFLRDMSVDVQDAPVAQNAEKYPQMKDLINEQIAAYDLKRKEQLLGKIKTFLTPTQANDYDGYANAADRQKALLSPTKDKAPLEYLRDLSVGIENEAQMKENKFENSGPFGDALPLPDFPELRADFKEKRIKKIKRKGPEIQYYDEIASAANEN